MQRADQPEILDQLGSTVSAAELAENLADLAQINRLLGTRRALCRAIWSLIDSTGLAAANRPITVIDIGAGTGDVLALLQRQAAQRGIAIQTWALEYDSAVLQCLHEAAPAQPAIGGDARALPIATGGVDLVICAQMLHHLTADQVRAALSEYQRVARRGVILFDLDRSRLAQLSAWMVTRALSKNRLTRHDGVLSVSRAYHPAEISALLPMPSVPDPPGDWRFIHVFPFRWLAIYAVDAR